MQTFFSQLAKRLPGPGLAFICSIGLSLWALQLCYEGWREANRLHARLAEADSVLAFMRSAAVAARTLRGAERPATTGSPLARLDAELQRLELGPRVLALGPEGDDLQLKLDELPFATLTRLLQGIEEQGLVVQTARLERGGVPGAVRAELRLGQTPRKP